MTVYTTSKPEGEVFSDLPKDGVFYPAIQNKNQKFTNSTRLLVQFNFDLKVPQDKSTIGFNEFDQTASNLSKYFPLSDE